MHEMRRKLATLDPVAWASVSQSVSPSACHVGRCTKTAERINVLFGVETLGDARNIVGYGMRVLVPHGEGSRFDAVFAKLLWLLISTCVSA